MLAITACINVTRTVTNGKMFFHNYVHVISCSSIILFYVIITYDLLTGIWCENVIISRLFRSRLQLLSRDFSW